MAGSLARARANAQESCWAGGFIEPQSCLVEAKRIFVLEAKWTKLKKDPEEVSALGL